mmetsp:Transcript_52538/g.67358  ORF Transcript_52538/g.67358 Transcript_52538/m.67358 type:complete len:106 (-) Transcript_52538:180-497(-)
MSARSRGSTNKRFLEQENDQKTAALAKQISHLKEFSIDINTEIESQNRLLDEMDGQMGSASGMLSATIDKLGSMLKEGGSRHMIYLIVFVVFAFILIYFIMRSKS